MGADGAKALTVKDALADPKYLYYYFKSIKLTDAGYSRHFKFLKQVSITLPENFDDQIRIATFLTRAEKLIAKRKESIKALDELLKSTFLEMFGDSVVLKPVNYELKKTWLKTILERPNVVVIDFLYHPKADWWFDHHVSTFFKKKMWHYKLQGHSK